jgi:hypothetical protein
MYNNFPSDVMYEAFLPDYIIGSNVAYNSPTTQRGRPDEPVEGHDDPAHGLLHALRPG